MNFGTPVPLLIGIILILGALALFFLEKFRPGYERDSDKVYAVLLLISGLFLLAHLDMELLASFQQLLMAGMLTSLVIESIRSRTPQTLEQGPPMGNRPPRPSGYDNRPPARRVYRAELDDRGVPIPAGAAFDDRARTPRMAPAPDPRMAPARNVGEYRRNDYDDGRAMPRQPYEEYRGPAGRLQPSGAPGNAPNGAPPRPRDMPRDIPRDSRDNRYPPDNYSPNGNPNGEGRYGERPPARPPADRPPADRPPERGNDRDMARGQNPSESPSGSQPSRNEPSGNNQPRNPERSLNVRPYSEAPKLDSPEGADYRPDGPVGSNA